METEGGMPLAKSARIFGLVGSGESTASWSGILAQDQKYGETPSNRPYYSRWRTTTV